MVSLINVMKLPASVSRIRGYLHDSYALDHRSLAVFRIAVGIVVLIDLIQRFQYALTHYSDIGVLPRRDAFTSLSQFRWSLLFANGTPEFINLIFWAGFLAAIAMILGWRTRLATVILWVIVISLQTRNHHLNSGADTLVRVTLFWAMLLPLAKMWSVDNYVSREQEDVPEVRRYPSVVASVATFGLILQVACVYFFTAIKKDGPRWREEGTALYYALGARDVSNSLGTWLFQNTPEVMLTALTYGTLLLEYAAPIMLLLPLRSSWLRMMGVLLIVALQMGIASTMTVGLFPAISIASVLGILPTPFWNNVIVRIPFSSSAVSLRRKVDSFTEQLRPPIPQQGQPSSTMGHARSGYSAHSAQESQVLRFFLHPIETRPPLSTVVCNSIAAIAIVLVLSWNIQTVSSYQVPQSFRQASVSTGLYQNWSMFAPGPQTASIWFVVEGELESGEKVDLLLSIFNDDVSIRQPVVWDQSHDIVLNDKYWRKYLNAIRGRETDSQRFAAYTCRTWNAENTGEERLARVTFTRGLSSTLPEGKRAEPVYDQLGSWNCA